MELLKTDNYELESRMEQFQDSIFLNVGSSIKKVALDSILFIKGYGDYMQVKCLSATYTVHVRMKKLEESLPGNEFLRVHKSYLIRLDKVDQIFSKSLQIDETMIPVSKSCKRNLLKTIPWIK